MKLAVLAALLAALVVAAIASADPANKGIPKRCEEPKTAAGKAICLKLGTARNVLYSYTKVHDNAPLPAGAVGHEQLQNDVVNCEKLSNPLRSLLCNLGNPKTRRGFRGPAGPAGKAGAKGDPGLPGPAGPQGPAGPAGSGAGVGVTGPAGPQGPAGPAGPAGPKGEPGPGCVIVKDEKPVTTLGLHKRKHPPRSTCVGERGPKGDPGPAGKDGKDGRDGVDGRDGKDGLGNGTLTICLDGKGGINQAPCNGEQVAVDVVIVKKETT